MSQNEMTTAGSLESTHVFARAVTIGIAEMDGIWRMENSMPSYMERKYQNDKAVPKRSIAVKKYFLVPLLLVFSFVSFLNHLGVISISFADGKPVQELMSTLLMFFCALFLFARNSSIECAHAYAFGAKYIRWRVATIAFQLAALVSGGVFFYLVNQ